MTTNTNAVLIQGASIAASVTTYYTSPSLTTTRITQMVLANTDSVAHTVTIYLTPTVSPAVITDLVVTVNLAAGQSYVVYQVNNLVMNPGGSIQAVTDTASVITLKASGILIN